MWSFNQPNGNNAQNQGLGWNVNNNNVNSGGKKKKTKKMFML